MARGAGHARLRPSQCWHRPVLPHRPHPATFGYAPLHFGQAPVPPHFQHVGASPPQWTQLTAAAGVLPLQLGQSMTATALPSVV